jgi:hypothetical protein
VLGKIFVCKREEDAGDWIKLHNKDLQNLHLSLNIDLSDKIGEDEMGVCRWKAQLLVGGS